MENDVIRAKATYFGGGNDEARATCKNMKRGVFCSNYRYLIKDFYHLFEHDLMSATGSADSTVVDIS